MPLQCSRCNGALVPGSRFCNNCGMQFDQPVPADPNAGQTNPSGQFPLTPPPGYQQPYPIAPKKKSPILIGCFGLLALFFVIGLINAIVSGGKGVGPDTSSSPASSPSSSSNPASSMPASDTPSAQESGVTMANYNRIQTGMNYEQVKAILGKDGTEMSSNNIAGIKDVMYQWTGDGFGANMNAMFQNDKLVQKAQFGLQ